MYIVYLGDLGVIHELANVAVAFRVKINVSVF